ncbi:MAG: radical SAM protein [Desulfarculus sp.]|nr:radical SAM protein [Desulfarculus sp.]
MSDARRLARQLWGFLSRSENPAAPPFRLWVDLTSRCNLRCAACPQRMLADHQRRDMSEALLERLAGQVGEMRCEVNLFHRGEPLLHPDFARWIKRFRECGARLVRLHTNATLLSQARAEALVAAGPDIVTLSIDTLDPVAYAAARKGADLAATLEGVRRLLAARAAAGGGGPALALLLMGDQHWGPAERRRLAELQAAGLERVVHRRPHNWGGSVEEWGATPRRPLPGRPHACTFPWYGLAVLSDGRVTPCPQDFFGDMTLGRADQAQLMEIWRAQAARRLRRAQTAHVLERYPVCESCDRPRRPTLLGLPREQLKNLFVESIVSLPRRARDRRGD